MVKSPGYLNDVGFLIFETVNVSGVFELMGIEEGKVILIVVGVLRAHVRSGLTKGAVIPQVDDTLGIMDAGNYTKMTEPISMTGICLIVN